MINEIIYIYKSKYNFIDDLDQLHTLLNTNLISTKMFSIIKQFLFWKNM